MAHVAQAAFGSHIAGSRPSFGGPPGWNSAQSQARVDSYQKARRPVVAAQSAAVQTIRQGFGGVSFTRRPADGGFGSVCNPFSSEDVCTDSNKEKYAREYWISAWGARQRTLGLPIGIPQDVLSGIMSTTYTSKASIRRYIDERPPSNTQLAPAPPTDSGSGGGSSGPPVWSGPQPGQSGDGSASFTESDWFYPAIGAGVLVLGLGAILLTRKKKKGKR